jgi:Domain of unknown function (DUF5666)
MKTHNKTAPLLTVATLLTLLVGCGGGGGGGGESVVSSGVMTKGSVIVNGVHFEDNTARISIDDTAKTAAGLQSGMVVRVRGTIDDSGRNGTAQQVIAQSEVRGNVSAVFTAENPLRIVVLGQNVLVDDLTILHDISAPITTALVGRQVEVHGLRDSAGNIRATRIEADTRLMGGDTSVDEIRGVVSLRDSASDDLFNVGTQPVNASVVSGSVSFSNGDIVEVHCDIRPCIRNGLFMATRIEVEDDSDRPGGGQRFEVEGLISGFTSSPGDFSVAGVSVRTTGSTRFEGGTSADLRDDIKIEAEGNWDGTRLVARKIEFKRSVVRLQGSVTVAPAADGSFELSIQGRKVRIETDKFSETKAGVPNTSCVQVRGQRKAGTTAVVIVAGEIRDCSSGDRPFLQAPVEAENGNVLVLLGFSIDVGGPTDSPQYEGLNGASLSRAEFFAAVRPADPGPPPVAGTLVKVQFNNAGTVRQVELEDD